MLGIIAVVTVFLVLAQFALISKESTMYLVVGDEPMMQLEEDTEGPGKKTPVFEPTRTLPVVLMHGMGDAAGNGGMVRMQKVRRRMIGLLLLTWLCFSCKRVLEFDRPLQSALELMWPMSSWATQCMKT